MFSQLLKKFEESPEEQPLSTDVPTLHAQIQSLKLSLASTTSERTQLYDDNLKLQKTLKCDHEAKISSLEKELHQLRLQSKLKLTQQQKVIDQMKSSSPVPHSRQSTADFQSETDDSYLIELNQAKLKVQELQQQLADVQDLISNTNSDDNILLFKQEKLLLQQELQHEKQSVITISNNLDTLKLSLQNITTERDELLETIKNLKLSSSAENNPAAINSASQNSNIIINQEEIIDPLQIQIEELEETVTSLKQNNSELAKKIKEYSTQNKSLKSALNTEKESSAKTIQSIKDELERITTSNNDSYAIQKSNTDKLLVEIEELRSIQKNDENVKKKLNEINFSLEEQVKEFKLQLNGREQQSKTEDDTIKQKMLQLEKSHSENEERLRKMKGLLVAANKKMLEYKEITASCQDELKMANIKIEDLSRQESNTKTQAHEKQESYDQILAQINDERAEHAAKVDEINLQLKEAIKELDSVKTEYQAYKIKAHVALQQGLGTNMESRVKELEDHNIALEMKLNDREGHLNDAIQKSTKLESEIELFKNGQSVLKNQILQLESSLKEAMRQKQEFEIIIARINNEKISYQTALDNTKSEFEKKIQTIEDQRLSTSAKLNEKTKLYDTIVLEIENLRLELKKSQAITENLQDEKAQSLKKSASNVTEKHPQTGGYEFDETRHRRSSSSLFGVAESGSTFKQKETLMKIEQLTQLLTESELNVERLLEQEKVLKEELRNDGRMQKRENLNIEYLKNVVLSFFDSGPKDRLIPVLAEVLHLSPQEQKKLQKSVSQSSTFGFF